MVDYSKGLIYKLCCNDANIKDIYVGSTTNFIRRKCSHKTACTNPNNKCYNYHVYKFIRDNGGWCNWSMVLVREYNATNKMKLARKERKYIDKLKATLNRQIPTRTNSEYYQANKDLIIDQTKQYYNNNREQIRQKAKEYYKDNEEKIKQYKSKKVVCDCGCEISQRNTNRHKKSQKHKDFMNEQ